MEMFLGRLTLRQVDALESLFRFPELYGDPSASISAQNRLGTVAHIDLEVLSQLKFALLRTTGDFGTTTYATISSEPTDTARSSVSGIPPVLDVAYDENWKDSKDANSRLVAETATDTNQLNEENDVAKDSQFTKVVAAASANDFNETDGIADNSTSPGENSLSR